MKHAAGVMVLVGFAATAWAAEPAHWTYEGATGPEFMTDHIRTLSGLAKTLVSCYPNAGLPDSDGNYAETPEKLGDARKHAARALRKVAVGK